MKQIKTLLIAAILVLGASQTINAQAKTAHVDVSEIMTKMPAMLDAQKQLEKLSATYDAEYKKMADEFQAKLKKALSRVPEIGEWEIEKKFLSELPPATRKQLKFEMVRREESQFWVKFGNPLPAPPKRIYLINRAGHATRGIHGRIN